MPTYSDSDRVKRAMPGTQVCWELEGVVRYTIRYILRPIIGRIVPFRLYSAFKIETEQEIFAVGFCTASGGLYGAFFCRGDDFWRLQQAGWKVPVRGVSA